MERAALLLKMYYNRNPNNITLSGIEEFAKSLQEQGFLVQFRSLNTETKDQLKFFLKLWGIIDSIEASPTLKNTAINLMLKRIPTKLKPLQLNRHTIETILSKLNPSETELDDLIVFLRDNPLSKRSWYGIPNLRNWETYISKNIFKRKS